MGWKTKEIVVKMVAVPIFFAKGFIEMITDESLENHMLTLARNYRKEWREELCESTDIEEFGFNEFIGGKADAFEDCVYLIRKYRGVPDYDERRGHEPR
jgi:hypothetical protein